MQQSFLLKKYGGLDLWEQAVMSAEERVWWINRLAEEADKQNNVANERKWATDPPGPPPEALSPSTSTS